MTKKIKEDETTVDPFEGMLAEPGYVTMMQDPHADFTDRHITNDSRKLAVDWRILESEYIFGFIKEEKKTKMVKRVYPTISDLSKRHRCSSGTIGSRSRKGNWVERRHNFIAQLRSELDYEIAKSRALSLSEIGGSIDRYLAGFALAIQKNSVDTSKIEHFERAVRLKVWLTKEMQGDSSASTTGVPLEELARMHAKINKQETGLSDAVSGVMEGRAEREAKQVIETTGVAILSEVRQKRDSKAAHQALARIKRDNVTGWDVCDNRSA